MSAAGPRPPWIREENCYSKSRPHVTTRIGRRSPQRGGPRRLLASLSRGANYSPAGGSAAASLATAAASVGVVSPANWVARVYTSRTGYYAGRAVAALRRVVTRTPALRRVALTLLGSARNQPPQHSFSADRAIVRVRPMKDFVEQKENRNRTFRQFHNVAQPLNFGVEPRRSGLQ